jgi:YMGG-like Gly-zipper
MRAPPLSSRLPQPGRTSRLRPCRVAALALGVALAIGLGPRGVRAQTFQGVEYLIGVNGVRGPLKGQLVVTRDAVAFQGDDGATAFTLPRRDVDRVAARDSAAFGSVLALQLRLGDAPGDVLFRVTGSLAAAIGTALEPPSVAPTARRVLLQPRTRVRVTVEFQVYVGTVLRQDPSDLELAVPGDSGRLERVTLPTPVIRRVEVSRPGPSRAAEGTVIGLAAGAATGVLTGALVYLAKGLSCLDPTPCNRNSPVAAAALIGAGVGAVAGLVIGANTHPEEWEEVPWRSASAPPLPRRDGRFELGLLLRF